MLRIQNKPYVTAESSLLVAFYVTRMAASSESTYSFYLQFFFVELLVELSFFFLFLGRFVVCHFFVEF